MPNSKCCHMQNTGWRLRRVQIPRMISKSLINNQENLHTCSVSSSSPPDLSPSNPVGVSHSMSHQSRRRMLQHTATHRNSLQLTATHCNSLQLTATHCSSALVGVSQVGVVESQLFLPQQCCGLPHPIWGGHAPPLPLYPPSSNRCSNMVFLFALPTPYDLQKTRRGRSFPRTYIWCMFTIRMSHVTQMNRPCDTYDDFHTTRRGRPAPRTCI